MFYFFSACVCIFNFYMLLRLNEWMYAINKQKHWTGSGNLEIVTEFRVCAAIGYPFSVSCPFDGYTVNILSAQVGFSADWNPNNADGQCKLTGPTCTATGRLHAACDQLSVCHIREVLNHSRCSTVLDGNHIRINRVAYNCIQGKCRDGSRLGVRCLAPFPPPGLMLYT